MPKTIANVFDVLANLNGQLTPFYSSGHLFYACGALFNSPPPARPSQGGF